MSRQYGSRAMRNILVRSLKWKSASRTIIFLPYFNHIWVKNVNDMVSRVLPGHGTVGFTSKYFMLRWIRVCLTFIPVPSSNTSTLSASDLHNTRANIRNPLHNMDYETMKKIRQNKTWIRADIQCINLTPNRYNALAPAIVYVSNDVTIPVNGTEIVLKSTDRHSNATLFLPAQGLNLGFWTVFISRTIICNCFSTMWAILLPWILKCKDLQY